MTRAPHRRLFRLVLLLLLAAGCADPRPSAAGPLEHKDGGTLVFGTEQYPTCLSPLDAGCIQLEWLNTAVLRPTMARLLTLDAENNYVASDLVESVPGLKNGGITRNPFTITYRLNPKAVWDDGTPITGEDVEFTWNAYRKNFPGGDYEKITEIVPATHSVTLKFSKPYAPWKGLFPYVLKASAFEGEPEEAQSKLEQSLPFAGGPFKLQSFTDSEIVLVRNDKYYGKKARLSKVIFRRFPRPSAGDGRITGQVRDNTAEQIRALSNGEIQAFYPVSQPTPELQELIKAVPGGKVKVKRALAVEALWFNFDEFPVSHREVREALLYGLDRQAAVDATIKTIDPNATVNRCLWSVPDLAHGKWCNNDFPVIQDRDRARQEARQALERGGWREGPDGIYTFNGQRLVVRIATTSGNPIREHFQRILEEQAKEIGIEIRNDSKGEDLFARLKDRDFVVAMFSRWLVPDPSVTDELRCDKLPSDAGEQPDGLGRDCKPNNYYGWGNSTATNLMEQSDLEIDEGKRQKLFKELGKLMRRDIISIPLYQRPQALVWDSSRLGGDFDFSSTLGFSPQLSSWFLK